MQTDPHSDTPSPQEPTKAPSAPSGTSPRPRRRRMSRWLKVPLIIIGIIIGLVVLIPVLLYIPPVQTAVKDLATRIVRDKTGMQIGIDRFRLRFPLDVSLQGVSVVEAGGDTMVNAAEAIADVRILPLLRLDVQLNRLELRDGYYRFLSPDSSMVMKIRAGRLEVASGSSIDIGKSEILIDQARLADGDVSLYMNVWRQQSTPPDTTSTPFLIQARKLDIERVRFAMSMLPTIDTLVVNAGAIALRDGTIDLRNNDITARLMTLRGGDLRYIAPTPEYVAAHPAPAADTTAVASAPMTIRADSISVDSFGALYAIKGAKPLPGFDANYIQVGDLGIGLRDFYNQSASLRLPVTRIAARERSGLQIVEGEGLVALTEAGITLDALSVRTPYSRAAVTADLPFALMALQPSAPVNARLDASVGMADVNAFMPMLKEFTRPFTAPLNAKLAAEGRLDNVKVSALDLAMPGVFSLRGSGNARNALDFKNLVAQVDLDGEVINPAPIESLAGKLPVEVPPFKLRGRLGADHQDYSADLDLVTPQGGVLAAGHVGMTSERYDADLKVSRLNVAHFMPDLGIGVVDASVRATGAGFNPTLATAHTDFDIDIASITYQGHLLRSITLGGRLQDGHYSIDLDSPNEDLNLNAHIVGSLAPDDYCAEGMLKIYNADLQAYGFASDVCYGAADIEFDITAHPGKWLYDADLQVHSIDWHLPTYDLQLPDGLDARFIAEADNVECDLHANATDLSFTSPRGLQEVTDRFTKAIDIAMRQVKERNLDVEEMQSLLPPFTLTANASGRGMLKDFLTPSGIAIDTVALAFANDSILHGDILGRRLSTSAVTLDTLTFNLTERGKLFDYTFHMGNRPGVLDEFACVDVNGYAGASRLSAFVTQRNLAGKTGYRIGFTAAIADSLLSLHFTPLKSTIAYMPWTFNSDNHIDYNFTNRMVNANLRASSSESSILLMTEPAADGDGEDLHLNVANIRIQDFLNMSVLAPPVKATVDGDIRVHYDGKMLSGKGNVDVHDFTYERMTVGDFGLDLNAGVDLHGESVINAALKVNGDPALSLITTLEEQPTGLEPKNVDLSLTHFPLSIANAFLGKDVASLSGELNGTMAMTGSLSNPRLNGAISVDSVAVYLPIMGSSLKFRTDPVTIDDNLLGLHNFNIFGANANPLTINGNVDARNLSDVSFDLSANAANFQLINNDRRARSDLFGKLFLNLDATVKGPMKHFDINANLNVLGATDVTYNLDMAPTSTVVTDQEGVVRFVSFADTTQTVVADTVPRTMAMRIRAGLTITPGALVTVNLGSQGKVHAAPSGTVNYYQNFMGDMTLNGQIFTGNGYANYKVPVMGEKQFNFEPSSYALFNGDIMNPVLNISAYDNIRANVINSSGNSNLVNFLVTLNVTQTLSDPKIVFDLSTDDDLQVQNELKSMSPDQRSTQAMNLLVTGRYSGADTKTASGNIADNMLYSFLTSQLNSWAANNIRGVDLSFGIDQYDKSVDGVSSNTMSYSYQVSKSLFSNRFKIVVGGNYSTDASADENFAQNLISDISFEYTLKQTNSLSMLLRLFRHVGYESVLEGEISEMGVGFTMRRRLGDLRRLFKVHWGKRKTPAPLPADSIPAGGGSGETPAIQPADTTAILPKASTSTQPTEKGGDK